MRKLVLLMHCSLDGFVADSEGKMDWIIVTENMFDLTSELTGKADTGLYGRTTFQMMESYWPTAGDKPDANRHDKQHSEWYNKIDKVVISKTLIDSNFNNTRVIRENVVEEIIKLKQQNGKDIIMFGSPGLSHTLMEKNLIDDYWILINPILLGNGIPLFKDIGTRTKLKLLSNDTYPSGVVCLHYEK